MAIQILGNNGVIVGAGEETRKPLHIQTMPKAGNWYRFSGFTGTIGAALAAASEVLQFRFISGTKTFALIHRIEFEGVGIVAAASAAGPVGFEGAIARSWTVAGSGGTRIATTADNLQLETLLPATQVNDIGIATTSALTVGTKTLDANAFGGVLGGVGTVAITGYGSTSFISPGYLLATTQGDMPLVLANQEGFVIRTTHTGPASLTYVARFGITWCEVTAF